VIGKDQRRHKARSRHKRDQIEF